MKILVLNLMPLKITTETDLIKLLSNPLEVEIEFLGLSLTPQEHSYRASDVLHLL